MKSKTRLRRSEDQMIADLQERIVQLKARAATKAARKDPALKHLSKAIQAIDAALGVSADAAMRSALQEARATLSACLQLGGVAVAPDTRSIPVVEPATVLAYVQKNPGQRGEHIAAALGIDTKSLRAPMKRLIEEGRVRTKGERRGMQYFA